MNLIHRSRLVRHILFWLGVCLFFFILRWAFPWWISGQPFCPIDVYLGQYCWPILVPMLIYTYGIAYWLLPLLLRRDYWRFLPGVGLLLLVAWVLYGLLVLGYELSSLLWQEPGQVPGQTKRLLTTGTLLLDFVGNPLFQMNIATGLLIGIKLVGQWQQKQAESQRLEREKLSQELALLKLQINPDLLFAALGTLHQQTQNEPKQAPALVLNLAHYLRYVLYESQPETVPVAHEIEGMTHYVSLQKSIRPDVLVSSDVRGSIDNQHITPMLILLLLEQAFGAAQPSGPGEPAWVSIDLAVGPAGLTLKVIYSHADGPTAALPTLPGVRGQLAASYGDTGSLQTTIQPETCLIVLQLPAHSTQKIEQANGV